MARSEKYGEVTVEREPGNPLNGTDEPVFIIRARDRTAVEAVLCYRDAWEALASHGGAEADESMLSALRDAAGEIEAWQKAHPELVKAAD